MKNLKIIFQSINEMNHLDKRILPCCVVAGIIGSVLPFVDIYFLSKIIDIFNETMDVKSLLILIFSALFINFILFFINNFLSDIFYMYRNQMYNRECEKIASKLYLIGYETLEDSEFQAVVHKHAEAQKRMYSAFVQLAWMIRDFITGFLTLAISITNLIPLFKIGFTRTGNEFFEKPIFLIAIICITIFMLGLVFIISSKMNKAYFKANDEYSNLDRLFYYFLDMFADYKTGKEIRLYNEQKLIEQLAVDSLLKDGEKILKKASVNTAKSSSVIAIIGALLSFSIYCFIGVKGLYGLFSIGSLVLYSGTFMQAVMGGIKMVSTFGKTEEICPVAKYYFEILNTSDDMKYGEKNLDFDNLKIEFKNVWFKYSNDNKFTLENINLCIHEGEHIALVGENGSGKTTFIKLMCRLYDVTAGEILINGINIKDYNKESLRKLYAVVFQDFQLFSLPISQNISVSESYDKDKLYVCLKKSDIEERVLKMEKHENTYLYKNIDKDGVEISGGEAQKIALARALYKNSPIVILDEPTSALDPITEYELYNRFNTFMNKKTSIYISHRLSSCVFCDRVAVFNNSRLEEIGTHDVLLKKKGEYYRLWNAQAQYYLTNDYN